MRGMTRRTFLRSALAASSVCAARGVWGESAGGVSSRPPNIIFILADDLGYGDLGCYGQREIQTPNLDRMASEGMRFSQAYAGSTVCAPSRGCLLTGLHTGHERIRGNGDFPLHPEDVTVAEVLKKAGYSTAVIGKYGLGDYNTTGAPWRQGFDFCYGYLNHLHAHNYYPEFLWRNDMREAVPGNREAREGQPPERRVYSHDLFTEEALRFIESHREGPFFLYLAYTIPHANNERGKLEGGGMEGPSDEPYRDRPWPQAQRNHAAMITRLDRDVGRLLDRLRALGLEENTVVFFSSDNGPHKEGGADPSFFRSTGGLRGYKRDLYEGGIRVPFLVYGKGRVPAGQVCDVAIAFWDVMPTLAACAGVTLDVPTDGLNLAPLLAGKTKALPREYFYWEFHERGFAQAVRFGDWKAVRLKREGPVELYNLAEDVYEMNNVAELHPQEVQHAVKLFEEARTAPNEA